MSRTLSEWLVYQSRLHPRVIELGLERVRAVWEQLGAPRPATWVITVAGTNGKGSSVALLEQILTASGYRAGCYTSPHLLRYNERIRIGTDEVEDGMLCEAFERIEQARGETPLTYFEFGTLAALWCFAQQPLDVAILEVGLGGRLDAVNIIDADVGLITGIALDHTDWLGDDLEQIGREKAGIARLGRPLVYAAPAMPASIEQTATQAGATLYRLGPDYHYRVNGNEWTWQMGGKLRAGLPLPSLRGAVQVQNAAGVLAALALLPDLAVGQQAVREGLLNTRIPGRFEVLQRRCRWVLDVAHNPQAAQVLAAQLGDLPFTGRCQAVAGLLRDKAIADVLELLAPRVDCWHFLDLSDEPRGASAEQLRAALPSRLVSDSECWQDIDVGLARLDATSSPDDLILVFGSFITVGRVRQWLRAHP